MTRHRVDQKLSKIFQKDKNFEDILNSLNDCLEVEEQKLLKDDVNYFPTLHVLGAPRSGTTLATQLILSYLPVGYINNLIAAFWKAPIYGIELSKKLLSSSYHSDFKSKFGRTDNINEPHEFGYFWNYHLKYNDLQQRDESQEKHINWPYLSKVLDNMAYHFQQPVVFKSFLFGFHAHAAYRVMPKICFIYIKRDFLSNAFSILKLRKELNGDVNEWGSIKPLQYSQLKDLSVHEQIAGQILCMEHEYVKQLRKMPSTNQLFVHYEDICDNPVVFVEKVNNLLRNHYQTKEPFIKEILPFKAVRAKENRYPQDEVDQFLQARDHIMRRFPELLISSI